MLTLPHNGELEHRADPRCQSNSHCDRRDADGHVARPHDAIADRDGDADGFYLGGGTTRTDVHANAPSSDSYGPARHCHTDSTDTNRYSRADSHSRATYSHTSPADGNARDAYSHTGSADGNACATYRDSNARDTDGDQHTACAHRDARASDGDAGPAHGNRVADGGSDNLSA